MDLESVGLAAPDKAHMRYADACKGGMESRDQGMHDERANRPATLAEVAPGLSGPTSAAAGSAHRSGSRPLFSALHARREEMVHTPYSDELIESLEERLAVLVRAGRLLLERMDAGERSGITSAAMILSDAIAEAEEE